MAPYMTPWSVKATDGHPKLMHTLGQLRQGDRTIEEAVLAVHVQVYELGGV
jgi:hypothetical protein